MDATDRRLLRVVAVLAVLTLAGMWRLWPGERPDPDRPPTPLYAAVVVGLQEYECPDDPFFDQDGPCMIVSLEISEGPDEGLTVQVDTSQAGYPDFEIGDRVRVGRNDPQGPAAVPSAPVTTAPASPASGDDGNVAPGAGPPTYYVADFDRLRPLGMLLLSFILVVVAVGRWHGARSLLGLVLSLLIVTGFVVPAILDGQNPFAVAVVGSFAVMLVTLYLAHGVSAKTSAAVIGTAAALGVTALLGLAFVALTDLTGLSSEEANLARFSVQGLDLRGLVLAGLVIAALGVLDDVTVSQASTVFALRDARPDQTWSELFRRAMSVGRDHIASTVNTLVLAYAGASIPLLVLFSIGGLPVLEIANAEVVAEEVVKTLVGSIGLVSAVPLTTALAARVALTMGSRPDGTGTPARPAAAPDRDDDGLTNEEREHQRWTEFIRRHGDDDRIE